MNAEEGVASQTLMDSFGHASGVWPSFLEFIQQLHDQRLNSERKTLKIDCFGRTAYIPNRSPWPRTPQGWGSPGFSRVARAFGTPETEGWARDFEFFCPFLDDPFPTFLTDLVVPLAAGGHSVIANVPHWSESAWNGLAQILRQIDALPADERWNIQAGWGIALGDWWTIEQRMGLKFDNKSHYRFEWILKAGRLSEEELALLEYLLCIVLGIRAGPDQPSRKDVLLGRYEARVSASFVARFMNGVQRSSEELVHTVKRRFAAEVLAKRRDVIEGGFAMEERVADLLRACGYTCEVTKRRGDGGLDVMASKNNVRLGIQVKNHKAATGPAVIQRCRGSAMEHSVMPAVVAAKGFTQAARESAKRGSPVRLATLEEVVKASLDGTDPFFQGPARPFGFV